MSYTQENKGKTKLLGNSPGGGIVAKRVGCNCLPRERRTSPTRSGNMSCDEPLQSIGTQASALRAGEDGVVGIPTLLR